MKLWEFKILILSKIHKIRYKPYESLDFLPIWNFKKVEETGDLRYLIKNINYEILPSIHISLKLLWDKLSDDFIQLSNPEFASALKKEVIIMEAKRREFIFIKGCVDVLAHGNRPELVEKIRSLGYRFNDNNETEFFNSVIDLQRQLIGLAKVIEIKNNDFETKYMQNKGTIVDIEDTMTLFSQHFGVLLNAKTLTVKQYLSYMKRYNKAVSESQPKKWQTER